MVVVVVCLMFGVSFLVYEEVCNVMGLENVVVVMVCILECLNYINLVGGYLCDLIKCLE